MNLTRLLVIPFAVLAVLFCVLMGRQVLHRELARTRGRKRFIGSVEGVALLVMTAATAASYLFRFRYVATLNAIPQVEMRWLVSFGTVCAAYLITKAVRMFRPHRG